MYLVEDYSEHEYIGYKIRFWVQEGQSDNFMNHFCGILNKNSKTLKELCTEMMDAFPDLNAIQINYKGHGKILYRDWP